MQKYVYLFSEGNAQMRNTLGGKGANLAEMTNLGMPVPQGFTISTEACTSVLRERPSDHRLRSWSRSRKRWPRSKRSTSKKFGDAKNPLLVSVRSGARASMPGMMDTILNLGLNDEVAAGLIAGNPRSASLSASCTTPIAASSRCSPTSLWSCPRSASRSSSTK